MGVVNDIHLRGSRASQPAAAASNKGYIYCVTDEGNILERSNGSAWQSYSPTGSGSGTVTNTGTLAADVAVVGNGGVDVKPSSLTGIIKQTAGVQSAATDGTDYLSPSTGMKQIAQVVTTGSQATVDFSSIPATFTTLVVTYWAKDTTAGNGVATLRLKVNNDGTSGNYTTTGRTGSSNGSSFASTDAAAATGGTVGNYTNAGTTSEVGTGHVEIVGYASTAFFKNIRTEWANFSTTANNQLGVSSFAWLSTAAINQLTFTAGTAFTDGSIFTLYGLP